MGRVEIHSWKSFRWSPEATIYNDKDGDELALQKYQWGWVDPDEALRLYDAGYVCKNFRRDDGKAVFEIDEIDRLLRERS